LRKSCGSGSKQLKSENWRERQLTGVYIGAMMLLFQSPIWLFYSQLDLGDVDWRTPGLKNATLTRESSKANKIIDICV
jgi:hypothetical protein